MSGAIAVSDDRFVRMLLATVLVALLLAAPGLAHAQEVTGTWESRADQDDDRVYLSLQLDRERGRGNWQTGFMVDERDLSGIELSRLYGSARDVRFEMRREAGTIVFDGDIRNARGAGFFTFTVAPGYVQAMADRGFDGLSRARLFTFAVQNVTTAYVDELRTLGYDDLSEDELTRFAIHGVGADYIRGMNGLGYTAIEPDDLVKLRIHGVSLEYVRRVRDALSGR